MRKEAGPEKMAASGSAFSTGDEKEEEEEHIGVDRISELPEGILLSILSLLTLKGAAKTSLLSRRWVDLWKLAVTELNFDAPEVLLFLKDNPGLVAGRRIKFKNWVNRVVRQLEDGSTKQLTKFRVSFTLTNQCNSKGDIDRWLKFAISKRAESLELSLLNDFRDLQSDRDNYVFSEDCFNHIKTPIGLFEIKSLRSLRLSHVDVKGETIEHFISNCPYLEELVVCMSELLVNLRIAAAEGSSSSLALKRLDVRRCRFLVLLEIDNVPCLTHLTYQDQGLRPVELRLKNCVSLVDVNIVFSHCTSDLAFDSISCYARQLGALAMKIDPMFTRFPNVPEFTSLEVLSVETYGSCDRNIIGLVTLINACPQLHTLRLKMNTHCFFDETDTATTRWEPNVVRVGRDSIKMVEIVGFAGYPIERDFMEYMLKCFVQMERMVLYVRSSTVIPGTFLTPCSKEQAEKARKLALDYQSRASPAIDFVVV